MKVKLENIELTERDVRDEEDEEYQEHIDRLQESFEEDGQWDPVMLRPGENGTYEMISGHSRYRAAQKLGWDEIEAQIADVDDEKADELALKTNLIRKGLGKVEEGKILSNMAEKYDLSQNEIANRVGKSRDWVKERIKVALDVHPEVQRAITEGEISFAVATVIGTLDEENQHEFLEAIIGDNVTNRPDARELRDRFFNDTIYTVGYQGKDWDQFIGELKENEIEVLVDVRGSASSGYKPAFNGDVLSDRLESEGIDYKHVPELGVKGLMRRPYKEGHIGHKCFSDWYEWWVLHRTDSDGNAKLDLEAIADSLEKHGAPALMCVESDATIEDGQDIYCHRHHLAEMIQDVEVDGRTLFPNRLDI